jgi:hypothetical protein
MERPRRKLTQVEADLQKYTIQKMFTLIKDVTQAFEIADEGAASGLMCIASSFAKVAVQVAVTLNMPKHEFMRWMSDQYDECATSEAKHNHDERND